MIDFHSHVLPNMDDGSKSVEESLEMLKRSAAQGVTAMALTPHFYADSESLKSFLERRAGSMELLAAAEVENSPKLLIGAEVYYFPGIQHSKEILQLRLEGTKYLLLEMPFTKWTQRMIEDVLELNCDPEVEVVLAHIDRYLSIQKAETVKMLFESGIRFQANAESFLNLRKRRRMLKMVKKGQISFLGSDCHDLDMRPPRLKEATEFLEKKLRQKTVKPLKIEDF